VDTIDEIRKEARQKISAEKMALGDDNNFHLKCAESGEAGDAKLFIHLFQDYLCFDHAAGLWHIFGPHYWREAELDEPLAAFERLIEVYEAMGMKASWRRMAAAKSGNEKEQKQAEYVERIALKKITALQRRAHRQNVLALAASGTDSLGITGKEWDR
jgi:hypothetical protein